MKWINFILCFFGQHKLEWIEMSIDTVLYECKYCGKKVYQEMLSGVPDFTKLLLILNE